MVTKTSVTATLLLVGVEVEKDLIGMGNRRDDRIHMPVISTHVSVETSQTRVDLANELHKNVIRQRQVLDMLSAIAPEKPELHSVAFCPEGDMPGAMLPRGEQKEIDVFGNPERL